MLAGRPICAKEGWTNLGMHIANGICAVIKWTLLHVTVLLVNMAPVSTSLGTCNAVSLCFGPLRAGLFFMAKPKMDSLSGHRISEEDRTLLAEVAALANMDLSAAPGSLEGIKAKIKPRGELATPETRRLGHVAYTSVSKEGAAWISHAALVYVKRTNGKRLVKIVPHTIRLDAASETLARAALLAELEKLCGPGVEATRMMSSAAIDLLVQGGSKALAQYGIRIKA